MLSTLPFALFKIFSTGKTNVLESLRLLIAVPILIPVVIAFPLMYKVVFFWSQVKAKFTQVSLGSS